MKSANKILLGLLFTGFLLRLIGIASRGEYYDATFSILLSEKDLASIITGTAADTQPPLFYFLLHAWMQISHALWFLRLLSVLFSLITLWLVFLLTSSIAGERAGLWAAFLVAISPVQIFHAQDLRMYALMTMCGLGYLLFFYRICHPSHLGQPAMWDWIGLVFFGVAAMYSHNLAGFVIITADLYLIIKRRWHLLFQLVLSQALMALLFLPWLVMVPGQIAKIQRAFYTPQPGLVEIIQVIVLTIASLPLPTWGLALAAMLAFDVLAIISLETWRNWRQMGDGSFLVFFCIFPPLLLLVVSLFMRPLFVPRAILVSMVAYLSLAGWVIAHSSRRVGVFLAASFVTAAAVAIPYQAAFNEFPRSPYREAAISLQRIAQPSSLIVHDNKLSYFPFMYYAPGLNQVFVADLPGSFNDTLAPESQAALGMFPQPGLDTAVGSQKDVWFVVFSRAIQEYRETGIPEYPALQWLRQRFKEENRLVFSDLEIYHFQSD